MSKATRPSLQKPKTLDVKYGEKVVTQLIGKNKEWIKEMATK